MGNEERHKLRRNTLDIMMRPFWTFLLPKRNSTINLLQTYPFVIFLCIFLIFALFAHRAIYHDQGNLFIISVVAIALLVFFMMLPKVFAVLKSWAYETKMGRMIYWGICVAVCMAFVVTIIYFKGIGTR